MKKECIFGLLLGILLFAPLSMAVVNDCTNENEIFSLSNENNAHGEIASQSSYLYEICYNQLFVDSISNNYTGEVHPSVCNNPIVKLSSPTNAHAGNAYSTNVCYADLTCAVKNNSCNNNEKAIASMSALTNAHLGKAEVYSFKICCAAPKARWENFGSQEISSAGLGWAIRLVYENPALADGEIVRFDIKEKDTLVDDDIRTGDNALSVAAKDGKASAEWQVTQGDLDKTKGDYEGFYFETRGRISNLISVDENYRNSYPMAVIGSPVDGGIYFTGTPIVFNHTSYDNEGPVSVEWDIGENLADKTKNNFTHSYSQAGQKNIKLTAKDKSGLENTAQISILVVDSASTSGSVYPFINSPREGQAIVSADLKINYNGEGSYAVKTEVTGVCVNRIRCLAGKCPDKVNGLPSCAGSARSIPITNSPQAYNALNFEWRFPDGNSSVVAEGAGKKEGVYGYAGAGNKMIELTASFSDGGANVQATTIRNFVLYDQRQCASKGTLWAEINDGGKEIAKHNTLSTRKCVGKDGIAGNSDDCCPIGWSCSDDERDPGCKIIGNVSVIPQCSDYKTEIQCNNDSIMAVRNNLLWNMRGCGTTLNENNILCSCKWSGSKCEFSIKARYASNPDVTINQCVYNTNMGECKDGYQTIDITASGSGEGCKDSKEIVPCGRPMIELPFFTFVNVVLALALIGLIHALSKFKR
jgi:PKD repeat protein